MSETKYCSSCSRTKPAGDFIHPRTGKDKKTCAECIMKRSAAAKRTAPIDTTATLQLHTTRLDDHEGRIACVEETLYDYDAAGGPPAPDAPGAGDGTFTKSQLRHQKRKNKKAARAAARALDFVLVGDDAASDSTTDLDSLASTHSCVRALIDENKQLSAGLRGMRLLLRDPSARLVQRVGRGMVGRRRAKSRLEAVEKIQAMVRRRAKRKFVAAVGIQKIVRGLPCVALRLKCLRASIVIAAAWRRYHVLSATPLGRLLSKTRRLAKELTETKVALVASRRKHEDTLQSYEQEITIMIKEKDETQAKLTKANEQLAVNENSLKNAVHATLISPKNTGATGASPFMKSLSKFVHELKNLGCANHDISNLYLQPAVAKLIPKGLKVEVKGNEPGVFNWSAEAKERGTEKQSWSAKIIQVKDGGKYEVEFDNVTTGSGTKKKPHRLILSASQYRIL